MEENKIAQTGVTEDTVRMFSELLERYKAGKSSTEQRIISSENWWKLRNTTEEEKEDAIRSDGFVSRSGWLHNVIVSKHADAVEAYPEPNILPREAGDVTEAQQLTAIIPCVLEQNRFEQVWSDVIWQKLKTGTGVYKVVWDTGKLGGLGDIGIQRVNLLNLYWEPGITDIQKSRYLFHTELWEKDVLLQHYPQVQDKLQDGNFVGAKFLYDDTVDETDMVTVVDVYYRKNVEGRQILHYCKFVGDTVLYATENDHEAVADVNGVSRPAPAEAGLYDHGQYPYVFDVLYPIEGSPCGYGYVDLCRNPQTEIDILKTAFVKNARVGAVPRYFSRVDGNVNEEQFLDLEQALVKVTGNVDEATLRKIEHNTLDGNYIAMLDRTIDELRQTSGNTETSTGTPTSGVTAASAIVALQEASGKGSRDSTLASYRAFSSIVELCIELIRQFYGMPRQFRITGNRGGMDFVTYTNRGLQPAEQPGFGQEGMRLPVFDIKISAQKKNVYTKVSQNELALQFFRLGFFAPEMASQAMLCLEMMDFDGKERILQRLYQNAAMPMGGIPGGEGESLPRSDPFYGITRKEHALVQKAREGAANAAQPKGGDL
ncbi:MAG: hypothetical protein IKU07_09125 [Oscillospiraceae bacterium]|nr:hypothetical protein [Oscillospiraceae bacterium]